jgi:short-subunit dehydrogenase
MPRSTPTADPKSILITGASSGIGAALARAYAAPGVTLALTGRDAIRLASVAETCRAAGATVATAVIDVADQMAMAAFVAQRDGAAPLDLVIANAGLSMGSGAMPGQPFRLGENTMATFAANIDGVCHTIHPALERMLERGRGQVAIMASLAAFRGLGSAPAYAASKAAVRSYGEGLRALLRLRGIRVSVICPGFVRSRMTERNPFPMPFLMEAEPAARRMIAALARDQGRIAFPRRLYAAVWLLNALPDALADWLARRMPAKG